MPDTCRKVSALLREYDTDVPTRATAADLREEFRSLAASGDSEVRDATPLLIRPTETIVDGVSHHLED